MEKNMRMQFKIITLVVALALSSCVKQTAEELVIQAKNELKKDDTSAAIIFLKNALASEPNNAEVRFLLGKSYIEIGAAEFAEKELTQALNLGYEKNEVLPPLANAYYLQYKNQELIDMVDKVNNLSPSAETSLLMFQALGYFQIDKPEQAKTSVKKANEISADSIYSQLGNAYTSFNNKQIEESLIEVDKLLLLSPELPEALLLKAQLLTLKNDTAGSVKYFEMYSELLPNLLQARVFLANAYLKNKQFKNSEKIVDQLLKINSEQAFLNQIKGFIRYQSDDFTNAKFFTEKAIQNGLSTVPNRIIAGISSFKLQNHEQAYEHLEAIQDDLPKQHVIRKLFAMVALELGQNSEAASSLQDLEGLSEDDIVLLSAASTQFMNAGRIKEAREIMSKAESMDYNNPLRRAQKGMMRLSLNDIEGLTDLEEALAQEPGLEGINTALARAYIDNGIYEKALELGKQWIEQNNQETSGYVLTAIAYLNLGDITNAEAMYDEVVAIDRENPAANLYFADKAYNTGDENMALSFLNIILEGHPTYFPALKRQFLLHTKNNKIDTGLAAIETARQLAPENNKLILLMGQALFTAKRYSKVIDLLEPNKNESSSSVFWSLIIDSYFVDGNVNLAIVSSREWVEFQPLEKKAYLYLIALLEQEVNFTAAIEFVSKAQSKFPDDEQFDVLSIHFKIVNNNINSASIVYEQLSDDVKSSPLGKGLYGQILLEQGKVEQALPLLKVFYKMKATIRSATLISKSYRELKEFGEAIDFINGHMKKHGESTIFQLQIAELAILNGNNELAIQQYTKILKNNGRDIRSLNNLALLLLQEGNYNDALQYAQNALKVRPKHPSLLDTLGVIQLKMKQTQIAARTLREAYEQNRGVVEIALNYAEALIANNESNLARKVLEKIEVSDEKQQQQFDELTSSLN
jgi:putative PEP-CTERM system TPR-repeat lipoprotein